MSDQDTCIDDPKDIMGYMGLAEWHRDKKECTPITEKELV